MTVAVSTPLWPDYSLLRWVDLSIKRTIFRSNTCVYTALQERTVEVNEARAWALWLHLGITRPLPKTTSSLQPVFRFSLSNYLLRNNPKMSPRPAHTVPTGFMVRGEKVEELCELTAPGGGGGGGNLWEPKLTPTRIREPQNRGIENNTQHNHRGQERLQTQCNNEKEGIFLSSYFLDDSKGPLVEKISEKWSRPVLFKGHNSFCLVLT